MLGGVNLALIFRMGFLALFGSLLPLAVRCKKNARFLDGECREQEGVKT
jgi:hypothetical protein